MWPADSLGNLTSSILQVRSWEIENLPDANSNLAFDFLTLVAHRTSIGQPLSLKQIYSHLPCYSEAGIRKQLLRCVDQKWLRIAPSETDKRVRLVVAEPALLTRYSEYGKLLQSTYGRAP